MCLLTAPKRLQILKRYTFVLEISSLDLALKGLLVYLSDIIFAYENLIVI